MISQSTVAAVSLIAFMAFMSGYSIGWRDRASIPIDAPPATAEDDLETRARRFQ